ncbi:TonB-linked outer membrane protein, SusC/RagA family [Sphingobacterium nematocida]|uniref:TonB-linked outer membrane protein, SusC/RagA family n=1 Tax=Sphingobacterium nematocida TaxID=1513896 RepID=A0A1T5DWG6_9SPHI|nr:SusC/RagA family TonB-linked outer membrane protein [Sphingobacterium nematocida]SKB75979.1 TonB-linked outer membrane protein, SusC/RagA family [Sphingobacterium nematocida]
MNHQIFYASLQIYNYLLNLSRIKGSNSRSAVEGDSNTTRRSLEAVPNQSRSGVEGLPKSSRSLVEEESKSARSGWESATFQKGAQTKVELAYNQPITRVELEMNYQTTKDELATNLERTNVELATTQETPKNGTRIEQESYISAHKKLPERYCKGTGKVLNSGGKGTGEVLESYQRGTKEVLTGSRSVVGYDRDGDCFGVIPTSRNGEAVVNDLRMNRLILRSFRALCEEFRSKVESMVVKENRDRQIALKQADNKFVSILPQAGSGSILFSLKPREAHTFLLDKESMQRTQGVECSPKFRSSRLNLKNSPNKLGSNSLRFYTPPDPKFLTAVHSKAGYKPFAIRIQLIATMIFMLFSGLGLSGAVAQSPQHRGVVQQQQESVLRGVVLSEVDGMPVANATISVGAKTVHSVKDGTFRIAVDKPHGSLIIKHIGYKEQSVAYDKTSTLIKVRLEANETQIEEVEVVSTGFFSVPKERATGSFTHVNNELLSRSVGSNVIDRLKDVVPGITFNQTKIGKSNFYKEPSISIRGRSTIRGNAEPLVILDNFPYEGAIEDINPEDIESVTILQDAAAASIWGARAGNGVIVLTSKQGHREQPMQVNWRSDYSISAKPDLYYAPIIPMDEFIEVERFLFNKNAWNPYINQGYSYITPAIELLKQHRDKKLMDMELEEALDVLKGQDVRRDLEKYFYRPSSFRKTFLSFNGGGKRNTYYFSAGYDQNVSDKVGADNQRISINMRNSYELWKDKLKLDVGLLFAKALDRSSRNTSVGYNVLYDRLVDEVGNPLSIGGGNKFRQSYIDTAGNGLLKDWNYRPVEEIGLNPARTSGLSYQLSTGFEYKALDWLTLSGKYQYGSGTSEINWLWDAESFQMRNLYNQFTRINHAAGTATSAIPEGGQFNVTQSTFSNHNGRIQLAAHKDWGVHQFSMIMGGELNKRQTFRNVQETMLGYQPATETYTPMDLTARYPQYHVTSLGSLLVSPTQNQRETTDNRNVLMFGNASYSYDRRYTATFSVRKDRANIFGVEANKKGKPFMSAGVLWNLHEESFVQFPWLQKLSLRGTVGTMGNVSTASAYLTSQVGGSVNSDNGRKFQSIVTAPNPLLSWEKVRMLNLAMDFSLLNSKLSGTIERYYRTSTDLLSYNPMNPSSGISTLYGNWSAMKSSGWDISVNSRLRYSDFSWTGNLVFSHIKDRVTDYYEKPTNDRLYLTSSIGEYPIEGKPLNTIYSLPYAGLDSKGDPMGYLDGELSTDYANIYNNTPLSEYIYHGRATPSTFGSLRNSFAYKGLELSFMLSYHLGYYFRQKAFSSSSLYSLTGYGSAVFQSDYTQRWQQAGDEATTRVPRATYPANGNRESFYSMAEDHVQPGDHIRFRDIRLSYSFPSLKNGLIRNLQVYGYVDNVALLWAANDSGFDPLAIPDTGLTHPTPRTYALGLNLKF